MVASSAFVLAALTMTGIYMQMGDERAQDEGYTLDFTALGEDSDEQKEEIALNTPKPGAGGKLSAEDDLDYMPLEAGSGNVSIPGLTGSRAGAAAAEKPSTAAKKTEAAVRTPVSEAPPADAEGDEEAGEAEAVNADPIAPQNEEQAAVEEADSVQLHFAAADGLRRPLEGETLIPFSMSGGVFFSTLNEYKYNPALMLVAQEGTSVFACAAGKVVNIFDDVEIGRALTMDLGDGYLLTYGQLKGINVAQDSYVAAGDMIGSVAAPTKYYCVEGANLYLKLTLNGTPVDPEALFQ